MTDPNQPESEVEKLRRQLAEQQQRLDQLERAATARPEVPALRTPARPARAMTPLEEQRRQSWIELIGGATPGHMVAKVSDDSYKIVLADGREVILPEQALELAGVYVR
jgi:hypothetical protein